jgi:DNA uptake protein ComE-like DNA-binding protein
MLSLESPRKPKNIIHRISDQKKPEQKDQKEGPQTPTSPPKSSGTGNKEEKILNFLNSMKTHQQLTIAVGKDDIIDETLAKNILAARTRLGKFRTLDQVSGTVSMDPKKFKALIDSLSAHF